MSCLTWQLFSSVFAHFQAFGGFLGLLFGGLALLFPQGSGSMGRCEALGIGDSVCVHYASEQLSSIVVLSRQSWTIREHSLYPTSDVWLFEGGGLQLQPARPSRRVHQV